MNTTTRFFGTVSIALATLMTACTDAEQPMQDSTRTPLNVNIHSGLYTRGGVISESYLPNASVVGLFLQKEDGTPYDNLPYNNIPYVATGTGASQTWSPQSADKQILLSATEGKAYAYYPHNAENTSFSSIYLDASRQDDVMYTSTASTGLNDKNADASFELQHALAVMKVKVKKGGYTGAGNVTSCSISGSPIGLTGTLDGTTGNLSGVTAGKVSADKSYAISGIATVHDIIFVPTTTSGQVTVGLTMDGKEYTTTTTSSETFTSNQCYTLNLTVDDSGATLSGIEVGNWTMSGEGNSIVTAGGYTITFEGDYSGMAFSVTESGGDVTILASGTAANTCPKEVTGSVALSQSTNAQTRTITITSINSDVTITFTGVKQIPMTYTWDQAKQIEGVWGILNGNPVFYDDATSYTSLDGVAIVIYGRAIQLSNKVVSTIWGDSSTDIEGLDNIKKAGGGSSATYGILPNQDGSFWSTGDGSSLIRRYYTYWPFDTGTAVSDTSGWKNTQTLIKEQSDETYIGPKTKAFRENPSYNQGYSDWFLPAAGQLGCFYYMHKKVSALLKKCSGATDVYLPCYSSTEFDQQYVWRLDISSPGLFTANGSKGKSDKNWIRLFRYITD